MQKIFHSLGSPATLTTPSACLLGAGLKVVNEAFATFVVAKVAFTQPIRRRASTQLG
ncbi:hypothetical protein AB5J62_02265 [Amycolatopsis sp. cg5]|uniref:hypothetical protein n=1 Tax=Amycolatopsis sp. cg5 TaxID=3238802 RepID=UPI0035247E43